METYPMSFSFTSKFTLLRLNNIMKWWWGEHLTIIYSLTLLPAHWNLSADAVFTSEFSAVFRKVFLSRTSGNSSPARKKPNRTNRKNNVLPVKLKQHAIERFINAQVEFEQTAVTREICRMLSRNLSWERAEHHSTMHSFVNYDFLFGAPVVLHPVIKF